MNQSKLQIDKFKPFEKKCLDVEITATKLIRENCIKITVTRLTTHGKKDR